MTLRMIGLLCFVGFLPFLALGLPTNPVDFEIYPVKLTIINELTNEKTPYSSSVIKDGALFGVLNNLQKDLNSGFSFEYSIHDDFGLFLESVNGLAGSQDDHTYWELLAETEGSLKRLDIGIGCYQPKKDEHIVLRFTRWEEK